MKRKPVVGDYVKIFYEHSKNMYIILVKNLDERNTYSNIGYGLRGRVIGREINDVNTDSRIRVVGYDNTSGNNSSFWNFDEYTILSKKEALIEVL